MKIKGLGSSAIVVAVLLLLTAGTTLAAGSFSGSWGRAFKVEPQLAELVRGENPVSDQIRAPFGQGRFGSAAAPKSKIEGCPAPCETPALIFTGSASGIGASDGTLQIQGAGFPIVTCYNPSGGSSNAPPGINNNPIVISSETPFFGDSVSQNGKAPVLGSVSAEQFPPPDPAVYCPNGNWTAEVTNILWVEGKVSLQQENGNFICAVTVFAGTQQHLFC
jgi:hypothetical protein